MSKSKILYFYDSRSKDSAKQIAQGREMGAKLRDRAAYIDGDNVERCDSVAGCYPDAYAKYEREVQSAPKEGDNVAQEQATKAATQGKPKKQATKAD